VVARGACYPPPLPRRSPLRSVLVMPSPALFGFPAETPRSRRRLVRLLVEGSVSFDKTIFLRARPALPAPCQRFTAICPCAIVRIRLVHTPNEPSGTQSLALDSISRGQDPGAIFSIVWPSWARRSASALSNSTHLPFDSKVATGDLHRNPPVRARLSSNR
jgi:hypothetical protein